MYVYIESEPHLYTVGFYKPDGSFEPESDHSTTDEAAARVAYLNGLAAPHPANLPAIRFTIQTISSKRDSYGNCYHAATITSTKTGKALYIVNLGGPTNAEHLLRQLLDLDWNKLDTYQASIPIREFWRENNRMANSITIKPYYEHEVTREILEALEKPE